MSYHNMHREHDCDCGLLHPTPCWKCPFLRLSPRIGPDACAQILAAISDEVILACIDEHRDGDGCAGVLVFLRNIVVVPRDERLREARHHASADLETVFGSGQEMMKHHCKKEKKT